jgi:hypothetical protein
MTGISSTNEPIYIYIYTEISVTDIETIHEMDETTEPVKRSGEIADGVFKFGDLHESGGYSKLNCSLASQAAALRRSQSTGDIDDKSSSGNEIPYIDSGKSNFNFLLSQITITIVMINLRKQGNAKMPKQSPSWTAKTQKMDRKQHLSLFWIKRNSHLFHPQRQM